MKIKGTGPLGFVQIYDDEWAEKFFTPFIPLLSQPDVKGVTIHREMGDFRYEKVGD